MQLNPMVFLICLIFFQMPLLYSKNEASIEEGFFNKGERNYSHKKYPLAIEFLKQAVKEDKTNGVAYFYLGNIYFVQKQYDLADIYYEKALILLPSTPEVLLNYASLKYTQKAFNESASLYNKAKQLYPHLHQAYEKIAMIHYRQLRFNKAANAFELLLGKFPDRSDKKNIEKWIAKLREKSLEAEKIRNNLLAEGEEIDALVLSDIFSVDLKNIAKEKEFESKNAETIKEFDVDLDILE